MTSRLYPPVPLAPGKQFLMIIECEGAWAAELMWAIWRNVSPPCWLSNCICSAVQAVLATIPSEQFLTRRHRITMASEITLCLPDCCVIVRDLLCLLWVSYCEWLLCSINNMPLILCVVSAYCRHRHLSLLLLSNGGGDSPKLLKSEGKRDRKDRGHVP
jgi:hypothetical protein